jgi:hypothetical protein
MNKKQIIRFFAGIIIIAIMGIVIATIKVAFFDCKHGKCLVLECVSIDQQCEKNNDQGGRDCCRYDLRETPFKDYLVKEIKFYSIIMGCGIGIAFGAFWADKHKDKTS